MSQHRGALFWQRSKKVLRRKYAETCRFSGRCDRLSKIVVAKRGGSARVSESALRRRQKEEKKMEGFEIWAANGSTRCCECGRWAHEGPRAVNHAKHCDTGKAAKEQKVSQSRRSPAQIKAIAEAGAASHLGTEDEIVGLVNSGVISASDAMNRDF
jgi:hypothetical protein